MRVKAPLQRLVPAPGESWVSLLAGLTEEVDGFTAALFQSLEAGDLQLWTDESGAHYLTARSGPPVPLASRRLTAPLARGGAR